MTHGVSLPCSRDCQAADQGPGPRRTAEGEVLLRGEPARRLAAAAAAIDVGLSTGTLSCPNDTGSVTVMVFAYRTASSAALWWHFTDCQTIDDGLTAAQQAGNPSFGTFQAVFSTLTSGKR